MDRSLPSEKRKSLRLKDRLDLNLKYFDKENRKEIVKKARVMTLSEEGLSFTMGESLQEISKVSIEILLPPPFETLRTDGHVVWADDENQKYGIEFTSLKKSDSSTLDKYINRDTITKTIVVDKRFLKKKSIIEKPIEELRKPEFGTIAKGVKGIRAIREGFNISREKLADMIGVSVTQLHLMETQKIRPSRRLLDKLTKILSCTPGDIIDLEKWGLDVPDEEVKIDMDLLNRLHRSFVSQTQEFKSYLLEIKKGCDEFDKNTPSSNQQIEFINERSQEIFKNFDLYFLRMWIYFLNFNKKEFDLFKKYYQSELSPIFFMDAFNEYLYEKPLGYPGDFVMMEYIYLDNYIGDTTFIRLLHRFTLSVPIARAIINRKEYMKGKIRGTMEKFGNNGKVLSIACGPAREMVEYFSEAKLPNKYQFCCVDFEELALALVNKEVARLEADRNKKFNVRTFQCNVIDLIKNKEMQKGLRNQDLVYCIGLIDYLSDKFASRLTEVLFDLLNSGGTLIMGNIASTNPSRANMEILGEWYINHRSKEDMMNLASEIRDAKEIYVEEEETGMNYFLVLRKP